MSLFLTPIDDPYGYDAFRLRRSKIVPAGFGTLFLGASLGSFAILLPHIKNEDAHAIATELDKFVGNASGGALNISFADSNAVISLIIVIFFAIGVALLAHARNNRHNYMSAYPRIKDIYTPEQRKQASKLNRRWVIAGIIVTAGFIALGFAVMGIEYGLGLDVLTSRGMAVPVGIMLFGAAPGTWMITHGVIVGDRVDIFEYNYQALSFTNRYDISANQTGDRKHIMLAEKRIQSIFSIIGRCFVSVGAFCTVMLWAVPSLHTKLALVPLLLSFALWYVAYKIGEQIAKRRYEEADAAS